MLTPNQIQNAREIGRTKMISSDRNEQREGELIDSLMDHIDCLNGIISELNQQFY
ncbi:MAG: hypothetical protein AAGB35_10095 [Pseudomonadota bacterium]